MNIHNYLISSYLENLKTFNNWKTKQISPKLLASANFKFIGTDDVVQCSDCDILLHKWKNNDEPMKEHSSKSPECLFVKTFGNLNYQPTDDDVFKYLCATSNILMLYIKLNLNTIKHIKKGVLKHLEEEFRFFNSLNEIKKYFKSNFVELNKPEIDLTCTGCYADKDIENILFFCLHKTCIDCADKNSYCPICGVEIGYADRITKYV